MSIDSRDKRFSIMGLGQPAPSLYGNPDGTIGSDNRAQLLYLYSGITLGGAVLLGSLNVTLADVTLVATAELDIAASLAVTLDAVTLASTAELDIDGSLTITLENATLASTGVGEGITGTLTVTLGNVSLVASGGDIWTQQTPVSSIWTEQTLTSSTWTEQ